MGLEVATQRSLGSNNIVLLLGGPEQQGENENLAVDDV
jgi:hypothetical protein